MTRRVLTAMLILMAPTAILAQPQATRPAFDVATIKLDPCGGQRSNRASTHQLISTDQTLRQLVVLA